LRHLFGNPENTRKVHADVSFVTGDERSRERLGKLLDQTVNRVCQKCNNGWMSDLEVETRPILTPLIEGRTAELSSDEQRSIAAWLVKTGLVQDLSSPPSKVPPEHCSTFYGSRLPLDHTHIWLLARPASALALAFFNHRVRPARIPVVDGRRDYTREAQAFEGYLQTFAIGRLVAQLLWCDSPAWTEEVVVWGDSPEHTSIWPPTGQSQHWPRTELTDDESLQGFAVRLLDLPKVPD